MDKFQWFGFFAPLFWSLFQRDLENEYRRAAVFPMSTVNWQLFMEFTHKKPVFIWNVISKIDPKTQSFSFDQDWRKSEWLSPQPVSDHSFDCHYHVFTKQLKERKNRHNQSGIFDEWPCCLFVSFGCARPSFMLRPKVDLCWVNGSWTVWDEVFWHFSCDSLSTDFIHWTVKIVSNQKMGFVG